MSSQFLERGIEFSKLAVAADEAGNNQEALKNYKLAAQHFLSAAKFERRERIGKTLRERAEEYLTRAEQLHTELVNGGPPAKPERKAAPASGGEDDDADDARHQSALEGAIVAETPDVTWSDVAGLDVAKQALQEAVIFPVRFPQLFRGRESWRGILLFGPPGTGKSFIASVVAAESNATFFSVSSADLLSRWLGESEKLVRTLFNMARDRAPSVIFVDEIDALCSARGGQESESSRRVKTEFLVQMNGVRSEPGKRVLVLAATNLPWQLDSAILRRFEKRIYIPLPKIEARRIIVQRKLAAAPSSLKPEHFLDLARRTEGYSGSDLVNLAKDALMQPVRRVHHATHFRKVRGPSPVAEDPKTAPVITGFTPCSPGHPNAIAMTWDKVQPELLLPPVVEPHDLRAAAENTRPSVAPDTLREFNEWTAKYGEEDGADAGAGSTGSSD